MMYLPPEVDFPIGVSMIFWNLIKAIISFTTIASWASIVGCGISVYLLFKVKEIKLHFFNIGRVPEIINELRSLSVEQESLIFAQRNKKNDIEIITNFRKAGFLLKKISKKANRLLKK